MASKSRMGGGSGLTNPRKEALLLYREILKTAKAFTWKHPSGVSWGQVLKESARKEFEQARWEKDPETIARMLLNGRHSLMIIQEKFWEKQRSLETQWTKEHNKRSDSW
ncbi:hypothetical protein GAYE_SCF03G2337 [Galdieria yellowstonensis]|uniref:Complex 1 LYR protein domain-containing protein n=1 Tax=Galdieria yellowstonensis TaxID=3028027 RepID=A0AAV9IAV9_9RHOD|nr:hypothetical protein GAYE_SCF03G2337 [Galdieria yellowstonensis]